jgi:Caspase domain
MAPYASIAIGIDRYQLFQPLNFASADAQAMDQFFQQSSGWTAERCLLMTDNSASINGSSTFPHQQNIQRWLEHFCWEVLQPGEPVCFFFSGYGLSSNGKEYLMPIDGDPQNPEQTGISLASLYRLFSAPGLEAMFFLDANRGINGRGFGAGAAELAKEFEIPTFLSCQAQEFSHEAMGLKQGIFTAVCLEALRSQPNLSLSKLQEYLSSRVPELSEHHWQPLQNPWAILPNNGRVFSPLFAAEAQASGFFATTQLPTPRQSDIFHPGSSPPSGMGAGIVGGGLEPARPARQIAPSASKSAIVPYNPKAKTTKQHFRPRSKSRLMPISIGLVGTSIAMGVIFANIGQQDKLPKSATGESVKVGSGKTGNEVITPYTPSPVTPPNIFKTKDPSAELLEKARKQVVVDNPDSYVRAIALGQEIPPDSPNYAEAQQEVEKWSKSIYQIANTYALKGDLKQAIDVAKLMPSKSPMYSAAQSAIRLWDRQQAGKPLATTS